MTLPELYKLIADIINDVQDRGSDIVSYVNQMTTNLSNSEIPSFDIERQRLDSQIRITSKVLERMHIDYIPQLLEFVFKLQKYVDDTYVSVNDFLSTYGIQVKPTFANISKEVGYPIDHGNIVNPSA